MTSRVSIKRPMRKGQIKKRANEVILSEAPYHVQHNMQMSAILLVNKKVNFILDNLSLDPLTVEEKAAEEYLVQVSQRIKALRDKSNELESKVDSGVVVDLMEIS